MSGVLLLQPAPWRLENAFIRIFTPDTLNFLQELCRNFDADVENLYIAREHRSAELRAGRMPEFHHSRERSDKSWRIDTLPSRLQCRHIDLGDVSASNTAHFVEALRTDVQAIQVDFDDGHCPTWRNQVQAYHNILSCVSGRLAGAPDLPACPVLMLRPRAWNVIEHNIMVDGKAVPGSLVDFALLLFHCGKKLHATHAGPYFYLSKLESAEEAALWDRIFVWAQQKLSIPVGTIKACVLIENILAVFEMDEILFALRRHSAGLNAGMWDYSASIVAKFGWRREWMLPDRSKYVNMSRHFLRSYLREIVRVSHARGAPATGGMAARTVDNTHRGKEVVKEVLAAKLSEIEAGVDGFLIYDPRLAPHVNELWKKYGGGSANQIGRPPSREPPVTAKDLLTVPSGGVTLKGVRDNVAITILFIYHWLSGAGHFFYSGGVEDSATAEISRWQIWQWIRFNPPLEDSTERVTLALVDKMAADVTARAHRELCRSAAERKRLTAARYMSLELFCARKPEEFVTSRLNDSHKFRTLHNKALLSARSAL